MRTVVSCALGECVHIAGVSNFLRLADSVGWRTVFLGPSVSIEKLIKTARHEKADLIGVSYRLTPENGERLLADFAEAADDLRASGVRFVFGGTKPVAELARKLNFFDACFDGENSSEQALAYLRGQKEQGQTRINYPQTAIERIQWKSPYPLLRHHFGQPEMKSTLEGIQAISDAGVLDVVSLGIDQDAQENFFHPERQSVRRKGAGGVPVRSSEDYRTLYEASRRGNFPLMRTYTGTDDFFSLAEMYVETINIAWAAIPLYWFNQLDGRGPWDLTESIGIHQKLMHWYGDRNIPVESNESHHWGMRDAPDVIYVVSSYLAAYNAREYGVKDYIAQMMFNSPPGTTDAMDLAKMLAILEMLSGLERPDFRIWRQTRSGLLSFPIDEDSARGHLAASVYLQMALKPHIIHVVGYPEADHAVDHFEVIESCKIAQRAIENAIHGQPDMTRDPDVQARKEELVKEARITLDAIRSLERNKNSDPLSDPDVLAQAVIKGILDAPQLKNNSFALGEIQTLIDKRGACIAINPVNGKPNNEETRLQTYLN